MGGVARDVAETIIVAVMPAFRPLTATTFVGSRALTHWCAVSGEQAESVVEAVVGTQLVLASTADEPGSTPEAHRVQPTVKVDALKCTYKYLGSPSGQI